MTLRTQERPTIMAAKAGKDPNVTVIYAEVPRWLKEVVEDEVRMEKRAAGKASSASVTLFTAQALLDQVNRRRAERGEPPLDNYGQESPGPLA